MKYSDYPAVRQLTSDNIILVDGTAGTKKILVSDALLAMAALVSTKNRRNILRGKNLGTSLTADQKSVIQDGSFRDLWVGDYWEIGGVKWRIADFNYWLGTGDTKFNRNHLAIVPDTSLYDVAMNDSSTTTGGYTGSKMYTTNLNNAKVTISSAFGDAVLSHRDYLINTVDSGYPSAGAYADSTVELMNEIMLYGSYIYTPSSEGSKDVKRYTINNHQLALFRVAPEFILSGNGFWLRDIASATHFCRVDANGGATATGGANTAGVRPIFAIG